MGTVAAQQGGRLRVRGARRARRGGAPRWGGGGAAAAAAKSRGPPRPLEEVWRLSKVIPTARAPFPACTENKGPRHDLGPLARRARGPPTRRAGYQRPHRPRRRAMEVWVEPALAADVAAQLAALRAAQVAPFEGLVADYAACLRDNRELEVRRGGAAVGGCCRGAPCGGRRPRGRRARARCAGARRVPPRASAPKRAARRAARLTRGRALSAPAGARRAAGQGGSRAAGRGAATAGKVGGGVMQWPGATKEGEAAGLDDAAPHTLLPLSHPGVQPDDAGQGL
jgi:hypothetical protein